MAHYDVHSFLRGVAHARQTHPHARTLAIPVSLQLLADSLTPIAAYRRLVAPDPREAPSFLLESVEGGERLGRYSLLGARPILRVVAREGRTVVEWWTRQGLALLVSANIVDQPDQPEPTGLQDQPEPTGLPDPPDQLDAGVADLGDIPDPLALLRDISRTVTLASHDHAHHGVGALPTCVLGGWFGYAAYDAVRYTEPSKLPFTSAPRDDRELPDIDFAFYDRVIAFDHVARVAHVVALALVDADDSGATNSPFALNSPNAPHAPHAAHARALASIDDARRLLDTPGPHVPLGALTPVGIVAPPTPATSTMTRAGHAAMVNRALEYIRAGDAFQIVLGQRFERTSAADPFDVYRALRAINPSPYMAYVQGAACILVASSPEILCRVRLAPTDGDAARPGSPSGKGPPSLVVTNRPLAGTRPRGRTPAEDAALERDLLADPKERAEHAMLVDLGRNDVGRVAQPGTVATPAIMEVERYSHVMHISSTVTGTLRPGLDAWDALRAALPVGTISGAPKVRAMQIIDELEPVRRGPYGGGLGYVALDGVMDIALALRTIVVPHRAPEPTAEPVPEASPQPTHAAWTYHMQASGGIVADSTPDAEFMETVNKAAALARAVELAERAFTPGPTPPPSAPSPA
jgi:anthranilate synthase component 1